jgi:hypothetical protein
MKFSRAIGLLLGLWLCASAQLARDTTLFTVTLTDDSNSLFFCDRDIRLSAQLCGPVVMDEGNLLLYSRQGFVLYDRTGTLLDSHSVASERPERGRDFATAEPLTCGYPLDPKTVVYYRKNPQGKQKLHVYLRGLLKDRLEPVDPDSVGKFGFVTGGTVVNIMQNAIMDEMARRVYLAPQLIGYNSLTSGDRFWSIERFYTFASPLIHMHDSTCVAYFPGLHGPGMAERAVDAVGTFVREGRRCYVGVFAELGSESWAKYQTIYICDEAGNVLWADSLRKQMDTDVELGKDADPRKNVVYTARGTKLFFFPPAVDTRGRIYYSVVDYDLRTMAVHERLYAYFRPKPAEADFADLVDYEKQVTYEPLNLTCDETQKTGAQIPVVRYVDAKGAAHVADAPALTRDEFIARVSRETYRDIVAKMGRRSPGLPPLVDHMRDSLAGLNTVGCPYTISLTGPRGVVRAFDYGAGERVVCARVLCRRGNGNVLIRVDLETYAEVLIINQDGAFVNRFTFNRQHWKNRKDLVVAIQRGPVLELDYEKGAAGSFLAWAPETVR